MYMQQDMIQRLANPTATCTDPGKLVSGRTRFAGNLAVYEVLFCVALKCSREWRYKPEFLNIPFRSLREHVK